MLSRPFATRIVFVVSRYSLGSGLASAKEQGLLPIGAADLQQLESGCLA